MMNRAFLAAISVVVLSSALGACSGDDTGGTGGADSGGTGSGASGGSTSGGGSGATTSGGGNSGSGASGGSTSGGGSGGSTGETLIGTPCAEDSDCPYDGGWCNNSYANGYCTKDCVELGPCDQPGTTCDLGLSQCHKSCTEATEQEDCRFDEGYTCVDRASGSVCEG